LLFLLKAFWSVRAFWLRAGWVCSLFVLCLAGAGLASAQTVSPQTVEPSDNAAVELTAERADELAALEARALAGESAAQFALGSRYLHGEGVVADNFEALRWFTLAADQDNANAQYNIAVMYLNGLGVIKDEAEAMEWFVKAANNGDRQSQFTLGVAMFNGQLGAPQNMPEAYKWFTLAGAGGHQSAAANAVLIQELLPPSEVARIQDEVRQWIEQFNQRLAASQQP
jgi:uncharacterized protein